MNILEGKRASRFSEMNDYDFQYDNRKPSLKLNKSYDRGAIGIDTRARAHVLNLQ